MPYNMYAISQFVTEARLQCVAESQADLKLP